MYADGASRGNPGPASIGVVVKDSNGTVLATIGERIGKTTNNQAEYRALIAGLREAANLGANEVEVRLDSELLVRQILGVYKVRNAALRDLYLDAARLLYGFASSRILHIPRTENREADALANSALDSN
ncbi:MAG: ribonuclease HI family protein [Chloroflexota bacterium]